MSQFTTLFLRPARYESSAETVADAGKALPASDLRYAFLALLAVNVFMISGAACFAALYFSR